MTCPHCATVITEDARCGCPRMTARGMANAAAVERLLAISPENTMATPSADDERDDDAGG